MSKIGKGLITIIYGTGAAIVLILLAIAVFQPHTVIFPDAMLPMELHELAVIWLAFGSIPMLIFSVLFYNAHDISNSIHKIRNTILTYIPAAVCLICVVFWLYIIVIGMVNTMSNFLAD